ncbi:MAG TPA: MaoC family dehydratase [Dehalococcoidia bacterium]|jgi:3-hydroxybutyryl-CoA dehydratase|nr:MaoC family dehydratase [Dehalococcoidia bacterium]
MPVSIEIGHTVTFTKTVSEEDVVLFAKVTGDNQPLHLDDAFAAKTRFKKRIAHGMLSAGFISAALGTKLTPDAIVVYLSQQLRFRLPVAIGDTITAEVEVTAIDPEKNVVTLRTDCVNQAGEAVVKGEATVMLDPLT